jgi:hypothetical protein
MNPTLLRFGVSLPGKETTDKEDAARELGASSVKFMSCDVKFVA